MTGAATRVLVQGVGAVGGIIASDLLAHGHAVDLVTNNAAITTALNTAGLRLEHAGEHHHWPARAWTRTSELSTAQRYDVVILSMMAGQVVPAVTESVNLLAKGGYFVALQNGFVEDAVAAVCGHERVVSGSVVFGATMTEPGVYHHTFRGRLYLGELDGAVSVRINALADLLKGSSDIVVSNNILGVLWSKLAWNCAVSALCAVSGKLLGELLEDDVARVLALNSYREALDTARAHDIVLERVAIDHEKYYLPRGASAAETAALSRRFAALAERYQGVKPSTLGSLERGRKSEIPWLNGYLVEQGRALGTDVRVNAALTAMVL